MPAPLQEFVIPTDSLVIPAQAGIQGFFVIPTDSLVIPTDSLVIPTDSLVIPAESPRHSRAGGNPKLPRHFG